MKISFKNDYSEGCHPKILEALTKANWDQQAGYGLDDYSLRAKELIKEKCNTPEAKIHFVSGGTQANLLVISAMLRPYESVIAATSAHIATNETGAIEATGHKVSTVQSENGKLTPRLIESVLNQHDKQPHQLKPRMVYISNSTELGTIYSKQELESLASSCKKNDMLLFMDGARLGQALQAKTNDLDLKTIAELTDVFYLGGTKNGALLGEAIVITNQHLQANFEYHLKQKGALLSKGRLLGVQFLVLFEDDLFFTLAQHANEQAMLIKEALVAKGVAFLVENDTNQIFPILSQIQINELSEKFEFYVWQAADNEMSVVRIITSWATKPEQTQKIVEAIKNQDF
jgi:threonine aldolase